MTNKHILEGFSHSKHINLPVDDIKLYKNIKLISDIFLTAIGHFPNAKYHYVSRKKGIPDETILIYCADGTGWCKMRNKKWIINTHDLIIIPYGEPHIYSSSSNKPWSIFWMHVSGKRINEYLKLLNVNAGKPLLSIHKTSEILYYFEKIFTNLQNTYSIHNLIALSALLAHFLTQINLHKVTGFFKEASISERIKESINYMKNHTNTSIKLSQLAAISSMSIPNYCYYFKKFHKDSPISYFLHIKFQKACNLLLTTNMQIQNIALSIGIDDAYYFSRKFKKFMGTAPSIYRDNFKQNKKII